MPAISKSSTTARKARPGRECRRKPYSKASASKANTTTYTRDSGMTSLPMRAVPCATAGMDKGSGPKNIKARFCRIIARPMVAIIPLSSSRRNGLSTPHSSTAPPATAKAKVSATAGRKVKPAWVVR
ncbi:hypothetical protein D3C71_1527640 [compost metagenome]